MISKLSVAVAAAFFALSVSGAQAAPMGASPGSVTAPNMSVIPVHGFHRDCRLGPGGWHRHNRFGERRACRQWGGQGKRPDFCVKVGKFFYCDY